MNMNMNPNSELVQSAVNVPNLVQVPDALVSQAREFQQAMMMYTCAIREVKTKLEVLNDELSIKNQRNPIEMIKSRVKKPISIVEKLQRRNLPVSLESMMNNLDDVAGIRVICSFVDDIYAVANMLVSQDGLHQKSKAERLPQLPSDHRDPGLLLRGKEKSPCGSPDPDHRYGFLGKSGPPAQIQKRHRKRCR